MQIETRDTLYLASPEYIWHQETFTIYVTLYMK